MSALETLATQLLIGTDRRAPDWPTAAGACGVLLTQIQADPSASTETTALRLAGALAVCTAAGFCPAPAPASQPPFSSCPEATRPTATEPECVAILRTILDTGTDSMRVLALQQVNAAGYDLPPLLLPRALALAVSQRELRAWLPAVIGERGRWLARLNPAWSAALRFDDAMPDLEYWERGTLEERAQFLAAERRHAAAAARERLAQTLSETDARGRARLLAELASGLSAEDEALLEHCLRDRSQEVRRQAVALLTRLPESGYSARMMERVAACFSETRTRSRSLLTIEPPSSFDPAWTADAIEDKPPKGEPLGQRAWWLYQLARALPLAWWTAQLGGDPVACVRWAKRSDWELAVLRAWFEALARSPSLAWTEALLARLPVADLHLDPLELIEHLAPSEREGCWIALLDAARSRSGEMLGVLLERIARTWRRDGVALSSSCAQSLLDRIAQHLRDPRTRHDYSLRRALPEWIACLPDALLDAVTGLPLDALDAATQAQLWASVRQRQRLTHYLPTGHATL